MTEPLPRAVAIVGPTAAGKGALGRAVAEALGLSIFVCDSVKVYRGLDIGSGKPDADARARVPHFGLDLVAPDMPFSAGDWAAHAHEWRTHTRGLVVGGTGFYLRAAAWSHSAAAELGQEPDAASPERAAFETRWRAAEAAAPGAIHRGLAAIDAATAGAIHPHNLVRALRALWLCELHGAPVSAVRRADPPRPRLELMLVVLDPGPEAIASRIERRVDAMLERGFLAEVEKLSQAGYHAGHKAMQSLGYRELLDVVEGRCDLPTARAAIVGATRQYARRQRTYVRHQLPAAHVIEIATPEACPTAAIAAFLSGADPCGGPS
ncbi:MAG TPA: tRNA (adenosine(37)-N6)-dimethylallyltransferase MiaA [Nannocystaceae bacterium]|nr:tRNA (adenosine(37)-N6)-dimethylallyltransferase MiaA [Nannocystaceae bacterium]